MTVCSLTPSRMGIITSRRTYSKPSFVGTNCAGVSLGGSGVCAAAPFIRVENNAQVITLESAKEIIRRPVMVCFIELPRTEEDKTEIKLSSQTRGFVLDWHLLCYGLAGVAAAGFLLLKSAMKAWVMSMAGFTVRIAGIILLMSSVKVMPRACVNWSSALPISCETWTATSSY